MLWMLALAGCGGSPLEKPAEAGTDTAAPGFNCATRFGDDIEYDDDQVGFSADEVIASLDGLGWSVAWTSEGLGEHAVLPDSISSVSLTVSAAPGELATILQVVEGVSGGCEEPPGTYLWIPVALALGADGALRAAGGGYLSASALDEGVIWVLPEPFALDLSELPEAVEQAGADWAASVGQEPALFYAAFDGPVADAALRLFAKAEWHNASGDLEWDAEAVAHGILQR